jgi:hypothetical protein
MIKTVQPACKVKRALVPKRAARNTSRGNLLVDAIDPMRISFHAAFGESRGVAALAFNRGRGRVRCRHCWREGIPRDRRPLLGCDAPFRRHGGGGRCGRAGRLADARIAAALVPACRHRWALRPCQKGIAILCSAPRFIGIRMVPTQDASLAGRRIEKIAAISLRHIDGITLGRGAGTPSTPPSSEPG